MVRCARNKQQTTLAFSPLPLSDPARAQQPEAIRSRAATVTLSMSPSPSRMRNTRSQAVLPTPQKSSQSQIDLIGTPPSRQKSKPSFMATGTTTITPEHKNRRKQSTTLAIPDDSESDNSDVVQISVSRRPVQPTSSKRLLVLDGSDSDEIVVQSRKRAKLPTPPRKSQTSAYALSDSDSEDPITSRRPQRRPHKGLMSQSKGAKEQDPSNAEVDDNESDTPPISASRLKQRRGDAMLNKSSNGQDQADLAEDIDFFKSSDTPSTTRRTASVKQNSKQAALEALKRKRLQRNTKLSASLPGAAQQPLSLDDSEESESAEDTEAEDEDDIYAEDLDQDEEDFVVDDRDDAEIGAPIELPFQFSRFQSMKAEELFKYAVEWMVQKKINPAFDMTDDVYRISFQRLDDLVKGMGGSKFQSSAWTSRFLRPLLARPILDDNRFTNSGLEHDRCDACNRSGHPATWEVRFQGALYDKTSLEEESDDEDSESDASEADTSPTFYIGKFCMQNARTAHTLAHWRYHLNVWVVDHLKEKGYLTSEKIVERDGWTSKKRRKYANKIADRMEAEGEIKRLHRDFRNEIKTAQFANDNY